MQMPYDIKEQLVSILRKYPRAKSFLDRLIEKECKLVLLGGSVRDFGYLGVEPRDLDIVVDAPRHVLDAHIQEYTFKRNSFGGYKVMFGDLEVDIWSLDRTHAFVVGSMEPTLENLLKTPVLNIDAIAYDTSTDLLLDGGFLKTTETKAIDWLNIQANANIDELNIARALVLAEKYKFALAPSIINDVRMKISPDNAAVYQALLPPFERHYRMTRKSGDLRYLINKYLG